MKAHPVRRHRKVAFQFNNSNINKKNRQNRQLKKWYISQILSGAFQESWFKLTFCAVVAD